MKLINCKEIKKKVTEKRIDNWMEKNIDNNYAPPPPYFLGIINEKFARNTKHDCNKKCKATIGKFVGHAKPENCAWIEKD